MTWVTGDITAIRVTGDVTDKMVIIDCITVVIIDVIWAAGDVPMTWVTSDVTIKVIVNYDVIVI